jgi:hypothetical protein
VIPVCAADFVIVALDGYVSLHAPSVEAMGFNRHDLTEIEEGLKKTTRRMADVLAARSKSEQTTFFSHLMDRANGAGTSLDADDLLSYGLVDKVSPWPKRTLKSWAQPRGETPAKPEPKSEPASRALNRSIPVDGRPLSPLNSRRESRIL